MRRLSTIRLIIPLLILSVVVSNGNAQNQEKTIESAGVNYYIEHVSKPVNLNWHVIAPELVTNVIQKENGFKLTLIPRVHIGQRTGNGVGWFDKVAWQYQMDGYVTFPSRAYLFTNYGYSSSGLFAKHQATAELTYPLRKGWGVIAGVKYTRWDETAMSYRVGVEKYIGKFWITLKPGLVVQGGEAFFVTTSGVRYYMKESDNYLHLGVYYGNSPEFSTFQPDLKNLISLGSWGTSLTWQQRINNLLVFKAGVSYRREEFKEKEWRNVAGAHAGLTLTF